MASRATSSGSADAPQRRVPGGLTADLPRRARAACSRRATPALRTSASSTRDAEEFSQRIGPSLDDALLVLCPSSSKRRWLAAHRHAHRCAARRARPLSRCKPKATDLLRAWIAHLALQLTAAPVRANVLLGSTPPCASADRRRSRTMLATCSSSTPAGCTEPLPLFPGLPDSTSPNASSASAVRSEPLHGARQTFERYESADEWTQLCLPRRGRSARRRIQALAERVWEPLFAAPGGGAMSVTAFDVADRAARTRASRSIEASAGTGKTYTLAGLFLRLIAEADLRVGSDPRHHLHRGRPPPSCATAFASLLRAARRDVRLAAPAIDPLLQALHPRYWPTAAVIRPRLERALRQFDDARDLHHPRLLPASAGGARVRERPALRRRAARRRRTRCCAKSPTTTGGSASIAAGPLRIGAFAMRAKLSGPASCRSCARASRGRR